VRQFRSDFNVFKDFNAPNDFKGYHDCAPLFCKNCFCAASNALKYACAPQNYSFIDVF